MEPVLWFVGFIVVLIAIGVVRNMINPPRDLTWSEVPQGTQTALAARLSEFKASSTRYHPVARKYKMRGHFRDREVEVEIGGNPDGSIREIELEDLQSGHMMRSTPVRFDELPDAVADHLKTLIGPDLTTLQTSRVTKGEFNHEPAYTIEGRTSDAGWEIEIAEAGRLIELEIKPQR